MTAILLALAMLIPVAASPPQRPRTPVLVELFTSEGCSSCPAADQLLARLLEAQPVPEAEIVALSLHVDYWDHQGWKDPFSSRAWTNRQQGYSQAFGVDRVYTPQLVVDGRVELVGSDENEALRAIRQEASRDHLPVRLTTRLAAGVVRLSIDLPAAPAGSEPLDVMVALAESGLRSVVRRGENSGRTLSHVAVVRLLETSGALGDEAFVAEGQFKLNRGWNTAAMRAVVWLQGRRTRHVYGVASAAL